MSAALDLATEYLEMVAAGVPVPTAREILERKGEAVVSQRAQSQPIPMHSDRFIGIGGNGSGQPSHQALLREAQGIPAIAARAIADRIASLEWEVVVQRRIADGTIDEEILDDHPLKLLLDTPSPTHSAVQVRRLMGLYLVTLGEAYLLKVGARRMPDALYMILPDHVEPIADMGRVVAYRITSGSGGQKDIPATDVVRVWNPDPATLYTARGVLGPQAIVADTLKFQQQHLRSHYETNAVPPVVIEGTAGATAPGEAIRERFDEKWLESYHRRFGLKRGLPAWIPPGWTTKMLDAHGGDTEIAALMQFHRDQMFMAYGVPRSIVGDVVDANRAAAETNQYVFDRNTVKPITDMIADALTAQLASDYPQPNGVRLLVRFCEFVSRDEDMRMKQEAQDLATKVRTVNQVREDRGLDPVAWGELPIGSFADVPYTGEAQASPLASGPADPGDFGGDGGGGDQASEANGGEDPEDVEPERQRRARTRADRQRAAWSRYLQAERRWVPTFTARMQRVFAIQRDNVLARLERLEPRARVRVADLFNPSEWSLLFERLVEPVRRAAFQASGQEALDSIGTGGRFEFTSAVKAKLNQEGQIFEELVNTTTGKRLSKVLADAAEEGVGTNEIAKRIREAFSVRRKQAVMIARTEMASATQAAQVEGFKQSGVVERHEWNTSLDDAVRDAHQIEGQVVPVTSAFRLADGVTARYPADPSLPAEDRINCRCFLTPVIE